MTPPACLPAGPHAGTKTARPTDDPRTLLLLPLFTQSRQSCHWSFDSHEKEHSSRAEAHGSRLRSPPTRALPAEGPKLVLQASMRPKPHRARVEGARGSQGMGVVSNNWFDRVLLPILHMFKPSCRPMLKTPFLGTPLVPLKACTLARPGLC